MDRIILEKFSIDSSRFESTTKAVALMKIMGAEAGTLPQRATLENKNSSKMLVKLIKSSQGELNSIHWFNQLVSPEHWAEIIQCSLASKSYFNSAKEQSGLWRGVTGFIPGLKPAKAGKEETAINRLTNSKVVEITTLIFLDMTAGKVLPAICGQNQYSAISLITNEMKTNKIILSLNRSKHKNLVGTCLHILSNQLSRLEGIGEMKVSDGNDARIWVTALARLIKV